MSAKKAGKRVAEGEVWIAVRLSEDDKRALEQWAEEEDRSQSYIVRRLVAEALAARASRRRRQPTAAHAATRERAE